MDEARLMPVSEQMLLLVMSELARQLEGKESQIDSPLRNLNSSSEVIRIVEMMHVRFPLSLRWKQAFRVQDRHLQ